MIKREEDEAKLAPPSEIARKVQRTTVIYKSFLIKQNGGYNIQKRCGDLFETKEVGHQIYNKRAMFRDN